MSNSTLYLGKRTTSIGYECKLTEKQTRRILHPDVKVCQGTVKIRNGVQRQHAEPVSKWQQVPHQIPTAAE
jgi:hypothetical protein